MTCHYIPKNKEEWKEKSYERKRKTCKCRRLYKPKNLKEKIRENWRVIKTPVIFLQTQAIDHLGQIPVGEKGGCTLSMYLHIFLSDGWAISYRGHSDRHFSMPFIWLHQSFFLSCSLLFVSCVYVIYKYYLNLGILGVG